jgi:hypothetical protein
MRVTSATLPLSKEPPTGSLQGSAEERAVDGNHSCGCTAVQCYANHHRASATCKLYCERMHHSSIPNNSRHPHAATISLELLPFSSHACHMSSLNTYEASTYLKVIVSLQSPNIARQQDKRTTAQNLMIIGSPLGKKPSPYPC